MKTRGTKRWAARLRKLGNDRQIAGALKFVDKKGSVNYCCLGAGMEMCVNTNPDLVSHDYFFKSTDTDTFNKFKGEGLFNSLPSYHFIKFLGLWGPYKKYSPRPIQHHSIYISFDFPYALRGYPATKNKIRYDKLNDSWNLTFTQIADMIDYFGVDYVNDVNINP